MTSPRVLSLISAVLLINITPIQGLRTYYMDDHCGENIYMYSGAILLELTDDSSYKSNMKCVMSLESNRQYMDRIMVRVLDIYIEGSGVLCGNDRLMIYNGRTTSSSRVTDRYGICGYEAPSKVYKSSSDWITFNFTSDSSIEGSGFRLLVTGFDDSGICLSSSEYECDNGICVDDDLKCDEYKNCEDDSDEQYCDLSVGGIVGIVIGCVAAIVVITVVVIVLAVNRKRACTNGRVVGANRSYLPAQPYTVYGNPIAGQYPAQNTMPLAIAGQYPAQNTMSPAVNGQPSAQNTMSPPIAGQPSAQNTMPPAYTTLYNTPLTTQGPPASAPPSEGEQKRKP